MIGRAVVTERGDEFLDANTFVIPNFEYDDIVFPMSLKFSLLRERNERVNKAGKIYPRVAQPLATQEVRHLKKN